MNTISSVESAESYLEALDENLMRETFKLAHQIIGKNNVAPSRPKYYINPKVKALEMGFKCPDDLSLD